MTAGTHFAAETAEAPEVVARQFLANREAMAEFGARLRAPPPTIVVTAARGSSDHAATYAKYLIEPALGVVVASAAPSLASVYGARSSLAGALYLAISQSGASPDLLASVEAARVAGALTVALVNAQHSPLAALAEVVLPLHAGSEQAVAATKTCIASFAAVLQLTAAWSGDVALGEAAVRLADDLAAARAADWSGAAPAIAGADHLFVIGRGVGFAAAQELALKFKETCALHAEAFSAAEVLHGPATLVGPNMPVLVLAQDDAAREDTLRVADRLAERGGTVLRVSSGAWADLALPIAAAAAQPMLMLQSGYALAGAVARLRGTDPDRPQHLTKVTSTR